MSKFYLSKRVLVVLILIVLVLIGAIGAYGSYLFSNSARIPLSSQNYQVGENSERLGRADLNSFEMPVVSGFHFIEDSSFLDLSEVFAVRSDESDREHYYTLFANPGMAYEETAFAEPVALPTVTAVENEEGYPAYDVIFPAGTSYSKRSIPELIMFDEVQYAGVAVNDLLSPELVAVILSQAREDIDRLVSLVHETYGAEVLSPTQRILSTADYEVRQVGYTYPPRELVLAFVYEDLLTQYVDRKYAENTVDTFVVNNILNQRFLQSDVAAAQILATQYLKAADARLPSMLFDIESVNTQ